jgi:hypothetical protein
MSQMSRFPDLSMSSTATCVPSGDSRGFRTTRLADFTNPVAVPVEPQQAADA